MEELIHVMKQIWLYFSMRISFRLYHFWFESHWNGNAGSVPAVFPCVKGLSNQYPPFKCQWTSKRKSLRAIMALCEKALKIFKRHMFRRFTYLLQIIRMVFEIERRIGLVPQPVFVILKKDRQLHRGQMIALWVRLPSRSRPKGHCCQVKLY